MTPFDIIKIINEKTPHDKDEVIADYVPFVINRGFSNMMGLIFYAAEISKYQHLDKDIQFDFYMNGIPKGKRFGKWFKTESSDESLINIVCRVLGVNPSLAKSYLAMLSEEQKTEILKMEGGK